MSGDSNGAGLRGTGQFHRVALSIAWLPLILLAMPSLAAAQDAGLRAGKLQLHPSLFLETGFDTNVFYEDEEEEPQSAPIVLIRPGFGVGVADPTSVDFRLDAGLTYRNYVSDTESITEQNGFATKIDGRVVFNPNGAVAFRVFDALTRTNEAPADESLITYNRLQNRVGAGILIQPGGKVLTLDLSGSYDVVRHSSLDDLDRDTVGLNAEGKWKFFPKTALILRVDQRFISYAQEERAIDEDDIPPFQQPFVNAQQNVDSTPLRIEGGVAGLVGNRFSVTALAGYGNGFYDTDPNFSGFIGRLELGYEIGPTSSARIGYTRSFNDSSFANYVATHRFFARYQQQFGGFFQLRLEGDFRLQQYANNPGPFLPDVNVTNPDGSVSMGTFAFSDADRVDPVTSGAAEGLFRFAGYWRVGARYQVDVNTSDFELITGAASGTGSNLNNRGIAVPSYVKHRFFLKAGVEW